MELLTGFRNVFSRDKTWLVFVMIVLGFIGSTEMVGVSSFCRFWLLEIPGYHTLNHFFRSSAWTLNELLSHWFFFVSSKGLCMTSQGRVVMPGDHTSLPRDGRKMPGVVTLHQESNTQSKPGYFRGQCWGAIASVMLAFIQKGYTQITSGHDSNYDRNEALQVERLGRDSANKRKSLYAVFLKCSE